jgi:hypothetical protein
LCGALRNMLIWKSATKKNAAMAMTRAFACSRPRNRISKLIPIIVTCSSFGVACQAKLLLSYWSW